LLRASRRRTPDCARHLVFARGAPLSMGRSPRLTDRGCATPRRRGGARPAARHGWRDCRSACRYRRRCQRRPHRPEQLPAAQVDLALKPWRSFRIRFVTSYVRRRRPDHANLDHPLHSLGRRPVGRPESPGLLPFGSDEEFADQFTAPARADAMGPRTWNFSPLPTQELTHGHGTDDTPDGAVHRRRRRDCRLRPDAARGASGRPAARAEHVARCVPLEVGRSSRRPCGEHAPKVGPPAQGG